MDLHGSVALVTGGAHRLGRAIALALGQAGATVAIHYHRSAEPARALQRALTGLGVEASISAGDLSVVAEAERVVDDVLARWGRLNLLVNNAVIWGSTRRRCTHSCSIPPAMSVGKRCHAPASLRFAPRR
jgi:pteridine reductase